MAYRGLIQKFDVKRPLNQFERANQLKQAVRLSLEPQPRSSVIRMNDSSLDITDKWFAWRGAMSILLLGMIAMVSGVYGYLIYAAMTRPTGAMNDDATALILCGIMTLPFMTGLIWLLRKESFAYTHYPIRFDRARRMVHVFRLDGSVMSARWDKIFFTLGRLNQRLEWEVRGHLLAPDGKTVHETFALSHAAHIGDPRLSPGQVRPNDSVRAHWEFVRRYMEEGPESLAHVAVEAMPIHTRKETAGESMRRIFNNNAEEPRLLRWVLVIPSLLSVVGRRFAMRTSKIPRWPAEIEKDAQLL